VSAPIRPATLEDVPTIAAMGERFHAEAGWADVVPYVVADCAQSLRELVGAPAGILLVAEAEGRLVGMAGGLAHPFYFNFAHRTGSELFWWVEPGLRDGTGAALLQSLEDAARAIGCESWAMVAVDKVRPETMARIYRRRGYRPAEHSFIKRLQA
jgi:GNAT superfamily N-acetyltransferase